MVLQKTSKASNSFPFKVLLISSFFSVFGCAKLAHLDQLLTIKSYSDNKELQERFVSEQNEGFERLLKVAQEQGLQIYKTNKAFLKEFGPPVFTRDGSREGETVEMWLYRYATEYWDASKVYVYFDKEGNLVDWEVVIPPEKTSADKTT